MRPFIVTKFRGTGQTENEVFRVSEGNVDSLFTYGTAGVQTSQEFKPNGLACRWNNAIYAIAPEGGIYKNTPPETSGVLLHSFTSPNLSTASNLGWQTVLKNSKTHLFSVFHTSVNNTYIMIFIDEEDNVVESAGISAGAIAGGSYSLANGLNIGNKIYSFDNAGSNGDFVVTDPETESIIKIDWAAAPTMSHQDLCVHNNKIYGYTINNVTTQGLGNVLWSLSAPIPSKILEWEAYQTNSSFYPSDDGQNLIFSDETDLILMGYGSGNTTNEFDVWKVDFDINDNAIGITSIRDDIFGPFNLLSDYRDARFWVRRDVENSIGVVEHIIFIVIGDGHSAGNPIHMYKWNGTSLPAEYLGFYGDSFEYDVPSDKIGGGLRSYNAVGELGFIATNITPSGDGVLVDYKITGVSPLNGVAIIPKFNNKRTTPTQDANIVPIVGGSMSGNFIAPLTAGQSGSFFWNISADQVSPGQAPNLNAQVTRII